MTQNKNGLVLPGKIKKIKLVPPDGGWGWMILLGTAVSNIFNQSMLSMFGLLYGDALEEMGHKTQGAAVVLGTMLFVTNFGGPLAGVLLKLTSPRVTAVTGACLSTAGIFFSGFSTNIVHLILTYGVLLGLGLGFIQNSSFVAINSYFKLRKSRAVGLANVGTGVGQSLMPHLARYLLENYGFQGSCLILSALSLHGIGGTLLIQPVEWHLKEVEEEVDNDENMNLMDEKHKEIVIKETKIENGHPHKFVRRATDPALYIETEGTLQNFNSERSLETKRVSFSKKHSIDVTQTVKKGEESQPSSKPFWRKLYELFDISLLSSPRFLNIIIGTALAVSSIQNFSMLYPFFLQKVAYLDKQQTATCMSAVALADIAGRLVLPIFQDKLHIKARWMLIGTSFWLIFTRQVLAYQTELSVLIVMSCLYGFGRSTVIVSRNIAISEFCRMDQVPAAVGLGMLTMGIMVPPSYLLLGWIRDYTGSYITCISAQNVMLVILLVAWIPDMIFVVREEKAKKKKVLEAIQMS